MKRVVFLSAGAALALSLGACDRTANPADATATAEASMADAEAVTKAFADFNADIVAKDLTAIRGHYADDAVMVLPGEPPFEGVEAIMADYQAFASDPAGKYMPGTQSTHVGAAGDIAYGELDYQVTYTNPETKAVETVSRYNLTVYRKQPDGSWKVARDVNTELPKAG